jgi:hypothetical protein
MAIGPLYPLDRTTAPVTVAAPGASAADTSAPVVALTASMLSGTILDFGSAKFAKLAADADVGDVALVTAALPTALIAGDVATFALAAANPILSQTFQKLSMAAQTAEQVRAEMLLGLTAPLYTGDDADELRYAIVLQINYQLERGATPNVLKAAADGNRGTTTTYRDRWVDPAAAAIVERVTGVRQVRFAPSMAGV